MNESASSVSAATGVVYAAEGANNIDSNPAAAGTLMEAGQEAIQTAVSLKDFGLKGKNSAIDMQTASAPSDNKDQNNNLIADPNVLSSTTAEGIFSTLEEKYGISRDDFVEKTLASRGSRETLQDLLKEKVSTEKFTKAFSAADELTKDEKKSIVQTAEAAGIKAEEFSYQSAGGKSRPTNLRESLRKKLAAELEKKDNDEGAEAASETPISTEKVNEFEGVTALSSDELLGREPAAEELSLFEVVHKKYRERSRMMETERGMILSPLPKE